MTKGVREPDSLKDHRWKKGGQSRAKGVGDCRKGGGGECSGREAAREPNKGSLEEDLKQEPPRSRERRPTYLPKRRGHRIIRTYGG